MKPYFHSLAGEKPTLGTNLVLLYYILQVLFIILYSNPEIQPFVYVRF